MYYLKIFLIIISLGFAAYSDFKIRKVRNKLIVITSIMGTIISVFLKDISIVQILLGLAAPFVICLPFYLLKMLKAGDIKLFMMIGMVMGFDYIIRCMALSVLTGGVISIFVVIKRKCFIKRMRYLFEYLKSLYYLQKPTVYMNDNKSEGYFPFATAVFLGVIIGTIIDFTAKIQG
ncbi:MAG: prepilin peptidase [Clostridiales bacterium]|nr:prepilin peptidase [Clostridiales bacterium]